MTLYEHRLARIIERRAMETAGRGVSLGGMAFRQFLAARGAFASPYMSASELNRIRARARAERDHAPTTHP